MIVKTLFPPYRTVTSTCIFMQPKLFTTLGPHHIGSYVFTSIRIRKKLTDAFLTTRKNPFVNFKVLHTSPCRVNYSFLIFSWEVQWIYNSDIYIYCILENIWNSCKDSWIIEYVWSGKREQQKKLFSERMILVGVLQSSKNLNRIWIC